MDTTLNDVLQWWANRPLAEALYFWFIFSGLLFCLYKVLEFAIRHSERKRIARLLTDPNFIEETWRSVVAAKSKTRR